QLQWVLELKWGRSLITQLVDKLIESPGQFERALLDKNLSAQICKTILLFKNADLDIDWTAFKKIILDPKIDWMPVFGMLDKIYKSSQGVSYLENLLKQLSEHNSHGVNNFEFALQQILSEPRALKL